MTPFAAAAVAFGAFALARIVAPRAEGGAARDVGLGAALGLLVGAAASAQFDRIGRSGVEETSAILLLTAIGMWSVRWTVVPSTAGGRAAAGHVATVALLGLAGAWTGVRDGAVAAALSGAAVGLAGWHLFAQRPARAGLVAGAALLLWPLAEGRLAPERAAQGFAALAVGALVASAGVAPASVPPRAWLRIALGFLIGLAPRLVAG